MKSIRVALCCVAIVLLAPIFAETSRNIGGAQYCSIHSVRSQFVVVAGHPYPDGTYCPCNDPRSHQYGLTLDQDDMTGEAETEAPIAGLLVGLFVGYLILSRKLAI